MAANHRRAAAWYASASAEFITAHEFGPSDIETKEYSYRDCKPHPDYTESFWWKMLQNPLLEDESSGPAKQFRRRFAVPFSMFLFIVDECIRWFEPSAVDKSGRPTIPVALKVLGSLRILAKGWCFDGVCELSLMSESSMHAWHHPFLSRFVEELFHMDPVSENNRGSGSH